MSLNRDNLLAPPWFMYPYIGRYSIGWRMGSGEYYIFEFGKWFSSITSDDKNEYMKMFPEPIGWRGWYEDESFDFYNNNRNLLWRENGKAKYSLEMIQHYHKLDQKLEYLFFWGHQPSHDESVSKSCFSQWWKAEFHVETNKYCCMEQYMMFKKAKLFSDNSTAELIMQCDDPKEIKGLGRKVSNFNNEVWELNRYSIVLNGNFAKFLQNENLMRFLMQTKNTIIVEASPLDQIWGIGMAAEDRRANDPYEWRGLNLLGFALMEVRDELNRVCENYSLLNLKELHDIYD